MNTLSPTFPPALRRLVVVDLETSGLDPQAGGILQIGAVLLDPARRGETFARDVRLEWWQPWEAGAAAVHGLTREEVSNHHRYTDTVAVEELLDWLDDTALGDLPGRAILAGMNPRFDWEFLRAVAVRADMRERFDGLVSHRTFDLHTLACAACAPWIDQVHPDRGLDRLKTDEIYALLGEEPEARPHTALEGARRERDAIYELLLAAACYPLLAPPAELG